MDWVFFAKITLISSLKWKPIISQTYYQHTDSNNPNPNPNLKKKFSTTIWRTMFQAPSEPRPALPGILRSVGRPQTNRLFSSHCVKKVHGISWRILIFIHLPKLFSPDPRAQGSGLGTGTHVTFSEELSHPIPRYILIAKVSLSSLSTLFWRFAWYCHYPFWHKS